MRVELNFIGEHLINGLSVNNFF